jgi:hypothetical protein
MKTSSRRLWWLAGIVGLALTLWSLFPTWVRVSAESLIGRPAPSIRSKTWINSAPIEWSSLRGQGRPGRDLDLRVNQLPE